VNMLARSWQRYEYVNRTNRAEIGIVDGVSGAERARAKLLQVPWSIRQTHSVQCWSIKPISTRSGTVIHTQRLLICSFRTRGIDV
jgi:hypothetical protein